jgi:hypothetical protein
MTAQGVAFYESLILSIMSAADGFGSPILDQILSISPALDKDLNRATIYQLATIGLCRFFPSTIDARLVKDLSNGVVFEAIYHYDQELLTRVLALDGTGALLVAGTSSWVEFSLPLPAVGNSRPKSTATICISCEPLLYSTCGGAGADSLSWTEGSITLKTRSNGNEAALPGKIAVCTRDSHANTFAWQDLKRLVNKGIRQISQEQAASPSPRRPRVSTTTTG